MVLVEQPGPWGRSALVQSRLDPRVGAALGARAVAHGMRVLLIRRPGRDPGRERRRWAVVDCRPGHEAIRWGDFGEDAELTDLPLDGRAGSPSYEPCFLVCTHGRHDACCAIRGRPVAAALEAARPGMVWECSHVGGDRFAANLVALPHGLYYGRVDDLSAVRVAEAHESGQVVPGLLRGRSTFAPVVQAAQDHARRVLGVTAISALQPVHTALLGQGGWEVRLAEGHRVLVATVRAAAGETAALLTCHATHRAHPPHFEVTDLRDA